MKNRSPRASCMVIIRLIQMINMVCGTTSQRAYARIELVSRWNKNEVIVERYRMMICSTSILSCKAFCSIVLFNALSCVIFFIGDWEPKWKIKIKNKNQNQKIKIQLGLFMFLVWPSSHKYEVITQSFLSLQTNVCIQHRPLSTS